VTTLVDFQLNEVQEGSLSMQWLMMMMTKKRSDNFSNSKNV
jgi:hypothetical protein